MAKTYSPLRQAIDEAKQAARDGVKTVRELLGRTNNPDLQIYERLGKDDFSEIVRDYGPEEAMRYIRAMELARLKEGE